MIDSEDREFLKGSNSSTEMLQYLSSKYNRPAEVCEAQLAQVKRLSPAKTDRNMIRNIMKFQTVHRDLSRYAAASKVDSYFINSVRHILLTDGSSEDADSDADSDDSMDSKF